MQNYYEQMKNIYSDLGIEISELALNTIMRLPDTIKTEHVTLSGDLNPISKDTYSNDIQQNENLDLEYHERELIKMALKRTDNNKSKAAAMLNVTWQALDRRMKKFELE